MIISSLAQRIHEMPGEEGGWWKTSSEETYNGIAEQLLKLGMTDDEVIDLLERSYFAATDCCG